MLLPRHMADHKYRNDQYKHRYDHHIAPINRFVDKLNKAEGLKAPYIAPIYRGVRARSLSVLSNPGPGANSSGFLSVENDDPSAERMFNMLTDAGIDLSDTVPWNAYPWYINRKPKVAEISVGVEHLMRIIDLLPMLRVVILHGNDAKQSWEKLVRCPHCPKIIAELEASNSIIKTYHPSPRTFIIDGEYRRQHIQISLRSLASILRKDLTTTAAGRRSPKQPEATSSKHQMIGETEISKVKVFDGNVFTYGSAYVIEDALTKSGANGITEADLITIVAEEFPTRAEHTHKLRVKKITAWFKKYGRITLKGDRLVYDPKVVIREVE
jgi:hypothetical protein